MPCRHRYSPSPICPCADKPQRLVSGQECTYTTCVYEDRRWLGRLGNSRARGRSHSRGECIMRTTDSGSASAREIVTNRRKFLAGMTATSLGLIAGSASRSANKAAASGSIGYVAVQGAELFAHPSNLTPLLYMDEG